LASLDRVRRFAFELPFFRRLLVECHLRLGPMGERMIPAEASKTLVDTDVELEEQSMLLQAARAISDHRSQRIFPRKSLKLAPH
jgi:hypothetical protein